MPFKKWELRNAVCDYMEIKGSERKKINKIVAKGSLVRWSKETEKNRYLVGTEFVI